MGHWFQRWCAKAGLPDHCTPQGLRRVAATEAAEGGASTRQLMAAFGWTNERTALGGSDEADRVNMGAELSDLRQAFRKRRAQAR